MKDEKVIDLIKKHFRSASEPVANQVEGLAITPNGGVFVVTDNGRDEKTLLLYLGTACDLNLTP